MLSTAEYSASSSESQSSVPELSSSSIDLASVAWGKFGVRNTIIFIYSFSGKRITVFAANNSSKRYTTLFYYYIKESNDWRTFISRRIEFNKITLGKSLKRISRPNVIDRKHN